MKKKSDQGGGTFDAKENFPIRYLYLYTNINNLRHFTSLNNIVAKNYFQTDIYNESFGSFFEDYLLLTTSALSDKDSSLSNEVDPVVLEFSLQNLPDFSYLSIDKNYKLSKFKQSSSSLIDSSLLLIPGYLPMGLAERIIFRSNEEMRNFMANKFRAMEPDYSKFSVDKIFFSGEVFYDLNKLFQLESNLKSKNKDLLQKIIQKRDRIRGLILASIGMFELELNENQKVNFDRLIIQKFAQYFHNDEIDIMKELNRLSDSLTELANQKGLQTNLALNNLPLDDTIYDVVFSWINNSPIITTDGESFERMCDKLAFFQLLELLREYPGRFEPIGFLNEFIKSYKEKAFEYIPQKQHDLIDNITSRYENAIFEIKKVINQKEKVTDILKRFHEGFTALKTFMIFATAYSSEHFYALNEKLKRFNIPYFERRIIWAYYGVLNGVLPLGEEIKKRHDLMMMAELIVQRRLPNNLLPDLSVSINTKLLGKGQQKHFAISSENNFKKLIQFKSYGVNFNWQINNSLEELRKHILLKINNPIIIEACLTLDISNKYIVYDTIIDDLDLRELKISFPSKTSICITHKGSSRIQTTRTWGDWELFKEEIIMDKNRFSNLTEVDIEVLLQAINKITGKEMKQQKTTKGSPSRLKK